MLVYQRVSNSQKTTAVITYLQVCGVCGAPSRRNGAEHPGDLWETRETSWPYQEDEAWRFGELTSIELISD